MPTKMLYEVFCFRTAFFYSMLFHRRMPFPHIAPPDKGGEDEENRARGREEVVHSEVRRDDTAEQRPRSRADLLRGEEESKDASFELRGR